MLDNKGKAELLGMPFGTAQGKLKKALLFELAGLLGRLGCYRCNEKIESIDVFSIEHKMPWGAAKDPAKVFFDLGNIAFSHIRCNVAAARQEVRLAGRIQEGRLGQVLRSQ